MTLKHFLAYLNCMWELFSTDIRYTWPRNRSPWNWHRLRCKDRKSAEMSRLRSWLLKSESLMLKNTQALKLGRLELSLNLRLRILDWTFSVWDSGPPSYYKGWNSSTYLGFVTQALIWDFRVTWTSDIGTLLSTMILGLVTHVLIYTCNSGLSSGLRAWKSWLVGFLEAEFASRFITWTLGAVTLNFDKLTYVSLILACVPDFALNSLWTALGFSKYWALAHNFESHWMQSPALFTMLL